MTVSSIPMTAQQFLMLGQDPPGTRLELAHGEIIVSPSPSYEHGYTDRRLSYIIMAHIDEHDLGELVGDVDTIFDNYDVRRPDIIFIAKERTRLRDPKKHGIWFPPDLCVEIVSPGSEVHDRKDKFKLYAECGVAHYWIVDHEERTFEAYKLSRKKYLKIGAGHDEEVVSAEPFPKLKIPLGRIWAPKR